MTYAGPAGTLHPFAGHVHTESGSCGSLNVNTFPSKETDESRLISYSLSGPIIGPDGTVISPPIGPTGGGAYATTFGDRNHNEITSNTTGRFFDTLSSSVPVLTAGGNGSTSSSGTFTYAAPSGANTTYTMRYTDFSVESIFGCSNISEYGTDWTTTPTSLAKSISQTARNTPLATKRRRARRAATLAGTSLRDRVVLVHMPDRTTPPLRA